MSLNSKDIIEKISDISGVWSSHIDFDGKTYWNIEKDVPYLLEYEKNSLPSDSNFREDVLHMRLDDIKTGQIIKEKMEEIQRKDRKLREKTS